MLRLFIFTLLPNHIKVERDIKTTFKTSEFVTRKVTTESNKLWSDLTEKSKPLLSLPATIQKLRYNQDVDREDVLFFCRYFEICVDIYI